MGDVDERQPRGFGVAIDQVRHFDDAGELDALVTHVEHVERRKATLHREHQAGHAEVRACRGVLDLGLLHDGEQ